jgi:[ribosomal protein S5]-alanine N-acetyltransferase
MVPVRSACPMPPDPLYLGMPPPLLETSRLILRGYVMSDAPSLARTCNDIDVVRWTSSHPFPYELKHAEEFIGKREKEYQDRKASVFAAFLKETDHAGNVREGPLVGAVGLHRAPDHQRAELGYLIGKDFWGNGYATEIARTAAAHGFEELHLTRIHAGAYADNAPSVRVLEKLGFRHEGVQRRHVSRFGTWHDLVLFGMLREEWKE